MKTSVNWLREYVDIPWDAAELVERLTLAGLEVEGIERIGDLPESIVVGAIQARAPHPNADRLSVCQVDDGSGEPLQVVCGAPNCDAGKKAAFARVGTTLAPDFTLKKAKIRGEASFGMLCSRRELGISDEHQGIMLLPDDAPVGTPLRDYLGTDTVVDWEVTSNRPDWLCHVGIARDIAALTGNALRLPAADVVEDGDTPVEQLARVEVLAPDLCPRYTARVITNVTIGPSPEWMQRYLSAVGLRPINNVVDITNFVMMECGQPLHAFDARKLENRHIIVRRARDGEIIRTLDDQDHELTRENLLICDPRGGVALAGIMGGENTEIAADTSTVLLESAVFNAGNIRRSCRDLGVGSDSSYRFERGVDCEMTEYASRRAAYLMCKYAGGRLAPGLIDVRAKPYEAPRVTCRYARVRSLLGIDIAAETVGAILAALGLEIVARDQTSVTVAAPSWRLDIEREADLIEEVARIHGLDKIVAARPRAVLGGEIQDDAWYPLQALRDQLVGLGLRECMTYSMVNSARALVGSGFTRGHLIGLKNPVSAEFDVLRPTLQLGMLDSAAHNIAHDNHDFRLFELGLAYAQRPDLPEERQELVIVMSGRRHPERFAAEAEAEIDFFDLRGVVETLLDERRVRDYTIDRGAHPALVPGATAAVALAGRPIGVLGQVRDELTVNMRLRHPLFMAILDADALLAHDAGPVRFHGLVQFPSVDRDVAFIAPEALENRQVLAAVDGAGIDILERVHLFDIFRDEAALGKGRKSMAYTIVFRSPERTLTDKEVNKAHDRLRQHLVTELGVELR